MSNHPPPPHTLVRVAAVTDDDAALFEREAPGLDRPAPRRAVLIVVAVLSSATSVDVPPPREGVLSA